MGAAVAVGKAISTLPPLLVAGITAVNFFAIAFVLWRKPDRREVRPKEYPTHRAMLISFAAIFFSEWGDVGQITAATLAAKYGGQLPGWQGPVTVWVGAVAAMVTKGTLAASVGAGVRGWIQAHFEPKTIRWAGVALLLFLGLLSVCETLFDRPEAPAVLLHLVG